MTNELDLTELQTYLDAEGRLTRWPSVKKKSRAVLDLALEYLSTKFDFEKQYTEREVNEILNRWHSFGDPVTLRREMVEYRVLGRLKNGSAYWRVDPDTAWQDEESTE